MSAKLKRLKLRMIWASVPGTYATLLIALNADAVTKLAAIDSGTVSMTSGDGHTVQFASPMDTFSPEDAAEQISELMDLYDGSKSALISSGIASPTDLQIYTEMLDRIQAVHEFAANYIGLRTDNPFRTVSS